VREAGSPHTLLQDARGALRALVDEGGAAAAASLEAAAKAAFEGRGGR
jgi:hypothetical protein